MHRDHLKAVVRIMGVSLFPNEISHFTEVSPKLCVSALKSYILKNVIVFLKNTVVCALGKYRV